MFKGATYKFNKSQAKYTNFSSDYAKVLDIRSSRSIHWTPTSRPDDEKHSHFWNDMPNGDIKLIVDEHREFVMYFWDVKNKKNTPQRFIVVLGTIEFLEDFEMGYDLINIDGVSEDV